MKPAKPQKGTPEFTAATRANILTALKWLGISCAIIFSDDPPDNDDRSRVKALDPNGLLMLAIKSDEAGWSHDSGQNHNKHGIKVRASYRSRTTPSVQVCVIEARGGDYDYCLEIDIDKYSPFVSMPGHILELAETIGPLTTSPAQIAAMLEKAIRA